MHKSLTHTVHSREDRSLSSLESQISLQRFLQQSPFFLQSPGRTMDRAVARIETAECQTLGSSGPSRSTDPAVPILSLRFCFYLPACSVSFGHGESRARVVSERIQPE